MNITIDGRLAQHGAEPHAAGNPEAPLRRALALGRPRLFAIEADERLFGPEPGTPSDHAVELLADQLWERRGATGRHLVVYGLAQRFRAAGLSKADLGAFLDRWAVAAVELHAAEHGARPRLSTADRPLGGLAGSLDYIRSFIPRGRRVDELRDLRRGLRYQGQLFQRDLSAACDAAGVDKAAYLAGVAPIVDETQDSIKVPHSDAGTTVSILHIDQDNVRGGRSQLTDVRALLAHLQRRSPGLPRTVLDLLAPVRKQGVMNGHRYRTDVVLGLRPEYRELARPFTLTIPDPARATTFFLNDVFDRVTGRLSALLHGAEAPRVASADRPARRMVMNRAVLAQVA
ncbi:MAG: hypothetical protein AAF682_13350 [Planctomycetota bacterium]